MTPDEMRARLSAARAARLATVDASGAPHLVVCCFAVDGEDLYTAVDGKPKRRRELKRVANIRGNKAVSVLADHYTEDWSTLWWVRVDGTASILDPGAARAAVDLLLAKYPQYRAQPPAGPVISVRILRWRGWTAEGG